MPGTPGHRTAAPSRSHLVRLGANGDTSTSHEVSARIASISSGRLGWRGAAAVSRQETERRLVMLHGRVSVMIEYAAWLHELIPAQLLVPSRRTSSASHGAY